LRLSGGRYVSDFCFHSQVECMLSRAAPQQRIQLCRFRALWALAGAWIEAPMNHGSNTRIVSFEPEGDRALVFAAKNGDGQAFELLAKRYQPRIFALAMRYTRVPLVQTSTRNLHAELSKRLCQDQGDGPLFSRAALLKVQQSAAGFSR
jgi:hypothetical protein